MAGAVAGSVGGVFREETMSSNSTKTGLRRLLSGLACCASFIAAGFVGAALAATHDFNHDARSDILWQNLNTGQVVIWLMNGASVIGGGSPGSALGWAAVGQGDFNGDG